jgi:hypothetical protein
MPLQPSLRADDVVSKKKTDDEIGPSTVTLSRSEGSVDLGVEMLRQGVILSAAKHLARWAEKLRSSL